MAIRLTVSLFITGLFPLALPAQDYATSGVEVVRGVETKIEQKIRMLHYLLTNPQLTRRADAGDDPLASELVGRARANLQLGETYFNQLQYLEAEAVLDFALRDLSAGSQLLSVSRRQQDKFRRFLEQLDSFALPEFEQLSEAEEEQLQSRLLEVDERRNQAIRRADGSAYDEAIALLKQAYRLKISLVDSLPHASTIVYDLEFDSIQDEYQYFVNRSYHYLDLVHFALSESQIGEQGRAVFDDRLAQSMVDIEAAETLEVEGRYREALGLLDRSIERLSSILRMLGVDI